jgi:Cft2 family RNA processing exonuclease
LYAFFEENEIKSTKLNNKMAVMNFGGVNENVVTREEFPLEKAREVLTIVYKNLNAKIKRSLVGYINKILEETLKNSKILKEEEKPTLFEQNDAQEQNTVQQMSSESLKVVKMLYDKMTDEEKEKFISKAMDIYLDENNGEMNKYTIRAFEQEDVKFYYIKKAIEQMN